MKHIKLFNKLIALSLFLFISTQGFAQTCASTSIFPFEWPAHRNWFVAASTNDPAGFLINMQNLSVTSLGTDPGGAIGLNGVGNTLVTQYEGTATVSDDQGNFLFCSNGRLTFSGTGAATQVRYNGLLEGNENNATGNNGSASQGIIIFRHPNTPNVFHAFTTDDANSSTVGLNHFVLDNQGALISGPTRLGNFRTSEALAATRHANGIDFWVVAMDVTGFYNAYLLTCNGIDLTNSNLNQAGAPNISSNNTWERGGMAFSWDGKKFAQTHGNQFPNANQRVSVYDFNSSTGAITNPMHIANTAITVAPYDILFSTDNQRLYVSQQLAQTLSYYDLSSGVPATISASATNTLLACGAGSAIRIGASGKMYMSSGNQQKGPLREINENINNSLSFSTTDVPGVHVALGLPKMFIPPVDLPQISEPGQLCTTGASVNLSTLWQCAGNDVELLPHTYSGNGITDPNLGVFDPAIAGVGNHQIIFLLNGACNNLGDTITISVINCNCNDAQLKDTLVSVCEGASSFNLNTVYNPILSGTWSVTAPIGSSSNPLSGSTFNPTGIDAGVYTLSYTLDVPGDASCLPETKTITVNNCCPAVGLSSPSPICSGESVDFGALITSGTGTFSITSGPGGAIINPTTGIFTSDGTTNGTFTITFTTDVVGCSENSVINLTVNPYPIPVISADALAICSGKSANLTASSSVGSGIVYTWDNASVGESRTVTLPGKYTVSAAIGTCSADTNITIGLGITPQVNLPADTTICSLKGESILISLSHNAGASATISWNVIGANGDNSVNVNTTPIKIIATVINSDACAGSDSTSVTEFCKVPDLYVPNVIVPGSSNPTFTPFGGITPSDIVNNSSIFEVYDRWGLKMYESDSNIPVWDATHNGRPVLSGVYFWIWKFQDITGKNYNLNGYVQVINK